VRRLALLVLVVACGPFPVGPVVPRQSSPPSIAQSTATGAPSTASPSAGAAGLLGFDGGKALQHVRYLADPARGGRFTASTGFADAAGYVADRFREIGLEPLGDDGTFFQRFSVNLVDLAGTPTLSRTGANAKTWTHRVDFTESIGGRAGNGSASATLAVVGGGAAGNGQDDFAGVEMNGRIALLTGPTDRGYVENVVQRGGVGVLVVGRSDIKYSYVAQLSSETIPVLVISEQTADDLLRPSGRTASQVRDAVRARRSNASAPPTAFAIDTIIQMAVPVTPVHAAQAMNVVGLLRAGGTEGQRALLIGGHLDGVGTDPNGAVFPAANDNASGPSIAIEIARVLAARKGELKRSVVFVAFAGEEEGFLGSQAYIAKMAATPGRVESLIAMINLDVIGCCGDVLEATNESRSLQDRVRAAAVRQGVQFNAVGGGGSDQESFSRRGVPSVMVLWSDYILHTTTDTIEKVDLKHLQRAGDVVSAVALELARGEGP